MECLTKIWRVICCNSLGTFSSHPRGLLTILPRVFLKARFRFGSTGPGQGWRRGEEKDANNDSKSSPVFTDRDLFNMVLKKRINFYSGLS